MPSIKSDRVIDNWLTMIENGAGYGNEVYSAVDEALKEGNIPQVSWGVGDFTAGLFGNSRELFVIYHKDFREYTLYLFARDIGNHLDCGWFMTMRAGLLQTILAKYGAGKPPNPDIFTQQDLAAWKYYVHRAFLKGVKDLMSRLEQDPASLNTTSKGFLSVW
jgi:hypothetical protein